MFTITRLCKSLGFAVSGRMKYRGQSYGCCYGPSDDRRKDDTTPQFGLGPHLHSVPRAHTREVPQEHSMRSRRRASTAVGALRTQKNIRGSFARVRIPSRCEKRGCEGKAQRQTDLRAAAPATRADRTNHLHWQRIEPTGRNRSGDNSLT